MLRYGWREQRHGDSDGNRYNEEDAAEVEVVNVAYQQLYEVWPGIR